MALSTMVIGIIGIIVIGIVVYGLWILNRIKTGYTLVITKDGRNPNIGERRRFILFDKTDIVARIYKHVYSLKPEKVNAYFDPNAFREGKKILAMQGITGKQDDDNIYPYAKPIMSRATAQSDTNTISDAVMNTLQKLLNDKKLRSPDKSAEVTDEDIKKSFTPDWLLKVMGIIDISDANAIMISQKAQVAASHHMTNQFRNQHYSWLKANQGVVVLGAWLLIMAVAIYIVVNSTLQYQQGLATAQEQFIGYVHSTLSPHNTTYRNVTPTHAPFTNVS